MIPPAPRLARGRQQLHPSPGHHRWRRVQNPPGGVRRINDAFCTYPGVSTTSSRSTQLQALPTRAILSKIPHRNATFLAVGLIVGFLIGRWQKRRGNLIAEKLAAPKQEVPIALIDFPARGGGKTPSWFNYALSKVWYLLATNTRQFSEQVLQPELDKAIMKAPIDFVDRIRLTKYQLGTEAPLVSELQPIPSRSRSEIQCSFRLQLQSTSDLEFEVDLVGWKDKPVTVPVAVSNLQIDAWLLSSFFLQPTPPYCSEWEYALLETPDVSFDMTARGLPVTSIPGLRELFLNIFQKEIPKGFTFPDTSNTVYFLPKKVVRARKLFLNTTQYEKVSEDIIETAYPDEAEFFRTLDTDADGMIQLHELTDGITRWGYDAAHAKQAFQELDCLSPDGSVGLVEFCRFWPNVTAQVVPEEYEGILSVRAHNATGLKVPMFGWKDDPPRLEISLVHDTINGQDCDDDDGDEKIETRKGAAKEDERVAIYSTINDIKHDPVDPGCLYFHKSHDFNVRPPQNEKLKVVIRDTSSIRRLLSDGILAMGILPLDVMTRDQRKESLRIDLKPQGSLCLSLDYSKFVDRWNVKQNYKTGDLDVEENFPVDLQKIPLPDI